MGFLKDIFAQILVFFYKFAGDYGLAIILLTVLVKVVTLPLSIKQVKSTAAMQKIAPEQKKLQEKYRDNPEKLNRALAELFRENKVSPFSGCLPLLIQFPVILAVFAVLRDPDIMKAAIPGFSSNFLGAIDLNESMASLIKAGTGLYAFIVPSIIPILSAATTYIQSKQTSVGAAGMGAMNVVMPLMIFGISVTLPQGLPLYWLVGNVFTIIQNSVLNTAVPAEPGGEIQ